MIFTISAICFLIGAFVAKWVDSCIVTHPKTFAVAVFVVLGGVVGMLTSLLTLTWRYLP